MRHFVFNHSKHNSSTGPRKGGLVGQIRNADDSNIYVNSRRAGERVMSSISEFIEQRLKLKVNHDKSAVDYVCRRKLLGYSFYVAKGGYRI